MRILFVSLAVPFPPIRGHRLRNWALLRALVEDGHEVALVSFAEPHELGAGHPRLREVCRSVTLVPLPRAAASGKLSNWARLRWLPSRLPYGVRRFRSAALCAAVRERLAREKFDVIICDDIYNVRNLPRSVDVPVLLNKHDITNVILRRYLAYERNPLKQVYGWIEYWKLRRWEARVCSSLSGVLASSLCDRELLKMHSPDARVVVTPNVIDTESYMPVEEDDGKTVLYVGAMDWYPNCDAVDFFISAVLPLLRRQAPGVRFVVAGRGATEELRRRFARLPEVEFTGEVADIRTEIARATVCVVPLRIGSGTRLKILEAGAMAKPIVSTRIGAEGLELREGEEILLADDPRGFARAVADLLVDPLRRRALGRAARRRVEAQYSLPVLRRAMRQALAELAGRPFTKSQERVLHLSVDEVGS